MKILKLFKESLLDIGDIVATYALNNLNNLATLLAALLPYLMYFIGQQVMYIRNKYAIGSEIFVPIIIMFIIYFLRSFSNKLGKGSTVPIPKERFTIVDDDGEVSVRNDRIQELILYLADLEDWMEKKKLL